jgi:putative salt-induced outer membrane protein YdiY
MTISAFLLLLTLQAGAAADTSAQDTLDLVDGSSLVGSILQFEDGNYRMNVEGLGEVSIPADKVKGLRFSNRATLVTDSGISIEGILSMDDKGEWQVTNELLETRLLNQNLVAINPSPKSPPTSTQKATITLNGSRTSGNTETTSAVMNMDYKFRYLTHRFVSKIDWTYAEDNLVVSKRSTGAELKYDFFPEDDWFLYTSFGARNDGFADLSLRTTAGIGAGIQVLDRDDLTWSEEAGISALNEDFKVAEDDSASTLRVAGNAEWILREGQLTVFHDHTLFVSLDEPDDILAQSRLGLRTQVIGGFSLNAQINARHDSSPPAGIRENDLEFLLGVGYSKSF